MSVARLDLNKCIGCRNCVNICPMDVFYFDEAANKSVMAYPENCQSCAQCYLHCMGGSLVMSTVQAGYAATGGRALRSFAAETAIYAPADTGSSWGGSSSGGSGSAAADSAAADDSAAAEGGEAAEESAEAEGESSAA